MAPVSSRVEARPDDVVVIYVIRHGQSRWNVARERCAAAPAHKTRQTLTHSASRARNPTQERPLWHAAA